MLTKRHTRLLLSFNLAVYAAICASPNRLVTFLLSESAKMYADIQDGNTDLSVFIFVTHATCLVAKLERDL